MENQKVFCLRCKKDLSGIENLKECECGSRSFVYGHTLTKTEDRLGCSCGSNQMEKIGHLNMNPTYISTYKCCKCGATISQEIYYESPYY